MLDPGRAGPLPAAPVATAGPGLPGTCRWPRPSRRAWLTPGWPPSWAALAYGLGFVPFTEERFDLVIPVAQVGSREVDALVKVLSSPWLAAQLGSLPGYDPGRCGEHVATL